MDRTIRASLLLLLVLVGCQAVTVSETQKGKIRPPALLQSMQDVENGPTVFYIRDEDERKEVAVDFGDAIDYARATVVVEPNTEEPQIESNEFMTGDVFDNDFSDESKLRIGVYQAPLASLQPFDTDETPMAPEEPPDTDEDILAVPAPVSEMEGDMDDDRWNPVTNMHVTTRTKTDESLDWGEYITVDDEDEWTATEVDTEVYIDDTGDVPVPAQRITTREMVYDLDEEEVNIAGVRYVKDDLNGVPLLYSNDSQTAMEGDMYDNQRTDQRPLVITTQEPINRLVYPRPQPPPPSPPPLIVEEVTVEDIDDLEAFPDVMEADDLPSLDEIDVVFEPVDIEVRDEDHDGDLDEVLAFNESDYMVGDLFNNKRTDEFKLTIIGNTGELSWPEDHDETIGEVEETEAEEVVERETVQEVEAEVDDIDNIYVTPETIILDVDEIIIPDEAIIEAEHVIDHDELTFTSPNDYMSGDLYNNQRTDSSLLKVNTLNGLPVTWPEVDYDEETIYAVEADVIVPDTDEMVFTTYEVEYQRLVDEDEAPETPETTLEDESLVSGDRRIYEDEDDVPAFFSSDSAAYLGGDVFDNDRSDSSRLILVLQGGAGAQWRGDHDDTPNPGFLP